MLTIYASCVVHEDWSYFRSYSSYAPGAADPKILLASNAVRPVYLKNFASTSMGMGIFSRIHWNGHGIASEPVYFTC